MSNLPQYYFGDIPAAVMDEIMAGMEQVLPEPPFAEIDHSLKELEEWLNGNDAAESPAAC
jgi:hypothetical protein